MTHGIIEIEFAAELSEYHAREATEAFGGWIIAHGDVDLVRISIRRNALSLEDQADAEFPSSRPVGCGGNCHGGCGCTFRANRSGRQCRLEAGHDGHHKLLPGWEDVPEQKTDPWAGTCGFHEAYESGSGNADAEWLRPRSGEEGC
jgi:hypothetical protein